MLTSINGSLGLPVSPSSSISDPFNIDPEFVEGYRRFLASSEVGLGLTDRLRADPRVIALTGKTLAKGSGSGGFVVDALALWVLWRINKVGEEAATRELEEYLDETRIEIVQTLWIAGVDVTEPVELIDGYQIAPIGPLVV